jgi:hypothetical protein
VLSGKLVAAAGMEGLAALEAWSEVFTTVMHARAESDNKKAAAEDVCTIC